MNFLSTGAYLPPPSKAPVDLSSLDEGVLAEPFAQTEDAQLADLRSSMHSIYPSLAPMSRAAPPKPLAPSKVIKREPGSHLPLTGDWDAGAWNDAAPLRLQAPAQLDAQADHSYGRVLADAWNAAASSSQSHAPTAAEKGKGKRISTSPIRRSGRLNGEETGLLKLATPKRPRKPANTAAAPSLDPISEQVPDPAQPPLQGEAEDLFLLLPALGDEQGFEPLATDEVDHTGFEGEEAPPSSLDSLEGISAGSSGSEAFVLGNEPL